MSQTKHPRKLGHMARCGVIGACLVQQWFCSAVQAADVLGTTPETAPSVYANKGSTPLVMLTMARDNSLFYPAYNDLSDVDGDGVLDVRFKPGFTYVGLFNSAYCYSYSGNNKSDDNDGLFTPAGPASAGKCTAKWSGNFLNYVTTSRIDALRVALYGGYREVDTATDTTTQGTTTGQTILRRAYIPQEGHAWAKEYTSTAVDGYDISQYTPLSQPTSNKRHFFGSLTDTASVDPTKEYTYTGTDFPPVGKACAVLATCSNYPPLLRVITNSNMRVWDWASAERPVLSVIKNPKAWGARIWTFDQGTPTDYTVRVKVCTASYHVNCKKYPNEEFKPTGVLHDYGENDSIYFGLLTGSYDQNLSGGRLRKNIASFTGEVTAQTGVFARPTNDSLVTQIDNIRIRNFNYSKGTETDVNKYYYESYLYRNGREDLSPYVDAGGLPSIANNSYGNWGMETGGYHVMQEGEYADWGNPIAEMMYEGLRYFAGETKTDAYNNDNTAEDGEVGLKLPNWVNPYKPANWCAKPSQMVISSVNPSFDSDQLPGAKFGAGTSGNALTGLKVNVQGKVDSNSTTVALNVGDITDDIGTAEGITDTTRFFIGESGTSTDGAPTLKTAAGLGSVRGLPPDDTNKQGSYYAAAVAKFGKTHSLQQVSGHDIATVDTFALLMNSPLPRIEVPFSGGKKISIVPFARTIDSLHNGKNQFQPTNQIVGIYILDSRDLANANGQYYLKLLVNFDDRSWGLDFDMDAIAEYEITATTTEVAVKVTPKYGGSTSSGSTQNIGYVVSGSTKDGPYLVVQPKNFARNGGGRLGYYYLNVPPGKDVGYCNYDNVDDMPTDCEMLPDQAGNLTGHSLRTFSPPGQDASAVADPYLNDPLWYAAKWGGYVEGAAPTGPTTTDPVSYTKVTSPAALRTALDIAFRMILDRNSSTGAVGSSSNQLIGDSTNLFQTKFNQKYFTGDLTATKFTVTPGADADTASYQDAWGGTAAQKLTTRLNTPAQGYTSRNIYYKNGTALSLFSTNTATLTIGTTNISKDVVNYLRGDTSKEMRNTGGVYRNRGTDATNANSAFDSNVLGSMINSAPIYFDATKTVYVGANDGMLHGFNSETGEERFAYIPSAAIPNISMLSDPNFTHRNYVDGNIAVVGGTKTSGINYLVGFMGRGAKGLYGLQVLPPSTQNLVGVDTTKVWDFSGAMRWGQDGYPAAVSTLNPADPDMGYLLGEPVIAYLNDGNSTPVVVFGNGYNSVNSKAALFVVRLSDGRLLGKFTTDDATSNGLATPGLRLNSGFLQYAYAGDYLGRVWRFDLSSIRGTQGTPVISFGTHIFTAVKNGIAQPITSRITVANSYNSIDVPNKWFLFFGTGSDLTATTTDALSTRVQSMYGVIDPPDAQCSSTSTISNTRKPASDTSQCGLTQIGEISTSTAWTSGGYTVNARTFAAKGYMSQKVDGVWQVKRDGWVMDWTAPADSVSEKVFSAATVRNATTPTLLVSSNIINTNSCQSSGVGFLNAMDAYHGGSLGASYFDINRDHKFADETIDGAAISSIDFGIGNIGKSNNPGNNVVVQGNTGKDNYTGGSNAPGVRNDSTGTQGGSLVPRRISWREIVK